MTQNGNNLNGFVSWVAANAKETCPLGWITRCCADGTAIYILPHVEAANNGPLRSKETN